MQIRCQKTEKQHHLFFPASQNLPPYFKLSLKLFPAPLPNFERGTTIYLSFSLFDWVKREGGGRGGRGPMGMFAPFVTRTCLFDYPAIAGPESSNFGPHQNNCHFSAFPSPSLENLQHVFITSNLSMLLSYLRTLIACDETLVLAS